MPNNRIYQTQWKTLRHQEGGLKALGIQWLNLIIFKETKAIMWLNKTCIQPYLRVKIKDHKSALIGLCQ